MLDVAICNDLAQVWQTCTWLARAEPEGEKRGKCTDISMKIAWMTLVKEMW